MEKPTEKVWYAMRATYGRNMSAKNAADNMHLTSYIPMRYTLVRGNGGERSRKLVPVIRDMIFIYATKEEIQEIKRHVAYLQYITRPVNNRNIPIIVPEREMQKFIDITMADNKSLIYLRPDELNLQEGAKVRIHGGEFDGYEGYFVKLKGKRNRRVVINIDCVIAIAIEVNPDYIEVINNEEV